MRLHHHSLSAFCLLFIATTIDALILQNYGGKSVAQKLHRPETTAATVVVAASSVLAATIILSSGPAAAATAGDISRGQQLFNDNCASCHMGGANYVNPDRTLKKEALVKYGIGLEPDSILSFVTNQSQRHKNLIFFRVEGGKLNPQQWEDATAFISDQAKGDKW